MKREAFVYLVCFFNRIAKKQVYTEKSFFYEIHPRPYLLNFS